MGGGKGPPRDWEEPRRKGKGSGGWKGEGKWWPDEDKGRGKDGKSKGAKGRETSKGDWQQWVPKDRAQEKWKGGKDRSEEEHAIRSQLSSNAPDFQPSGLYDFQSYGVPPPPPPPWHFEMPPLWQEFADAEGTKYYYNAKTGLTQWDRPAELEPPTRPEPPAPRAERRREEKREVKEGDKGDGKGKKRKKPVSEKEKEPSFGPPGCNLFVFHPPDDWTDEDLLEYFAPHGNVVSAKVMKELGTGRSRGFGFVSYEDRVSAATAIKKMQGFKILGKRLKVEFKKGEGDNGKDDKLDFEEKGSGDDERLIGYLRAISAKSVVQSLKESEKEDKLFSADDPEPALMTDD